MFVSCGQRKIWDKVPNAGPTRAKDAYIGPFARMCIKYAERFYPNSYVILSAKYGFMFPDEVIPGNYNITFRDPSTNPITVEELKMQAKRKGLDRYDEIVVIGGKRYVEIVRECFPGKKIAAPLQGIGRMGRMISAMKRAIRSGKQLRAQFLPF